MRLAKLPPRRAKRVWRAFERCVWILKTGLALAKKKGGMEPSRYLPGWSGVRLRLDLEQGQINPSRTGPL